IILTPKVSVNLKGDAARRSALLARNGVSGSELTLPVVKHKIVVSRTGSPVAPAIHIHCLEAPMRSLLRGLLCALVLPGCSPAGQHSSISNRGRANLTRPAGVAVSAGSISGVVTSQLDNSPVAGILVTAIPYLIRSDAPNVVFNSVRDHSVGHAVTDANGAYT